MKSTCRVILVQHELLEVDASYNTMISVLTTPKCLCFFESVVLGVKPASQEIADQDPQTALLTACVGHIRM